MVLFLSLCTFYCIKNKFVYFPCGTVFPPSLSFSCSQRYNHPIYRVPFARCNGFKYSFVSKIISLWNNLPLEAVNSETLLIFKHLYHLFFNKFVLSVYNRHGCTLHISIAIQCSLVLLQNYYFKKLKMCYELMSMCHKIMKLIK